MCILYLPHSMKVLTYCKVYKKTEGLEDLHLDIIGRDMARYICT